MGLTLCMAGTVLAAAPATGGPWSWQRIEAVLQDQGPQAADVLSQQALSDDPASLVPLWLHMRVELARGGPAAARIALTTAGSSSPQLRTGLGEAVIALEVGDARGALAALSKIPSPEPSNVDAAVIGLLTARALTGAGQRATADSVLASLRLHPLLRDPPDSTHALVLHLMLERVQQSMLAQVDLLAAVQGHAGLVERAREAGLRSLTSRLEFGQGRLLLAAGRTDEAEASFQRSASSARELGDVRLQTLADLWRARAFELLGENERCLQLGRAAATRLRQQEDARALGWAQLGAGWAAWNLGLADEAVARTEEARNAFVEVGEAWGQVQALNNLGLVLTALERHQEARERLEEGIALSAGWGPTPQTLGLRNNLGVLLWRMGRPDLAAPIYEELLALHRSLQDTAGEIGVLNNLALLHEQLHQRSHARALYRECIRRKAALGKVDGIAHLNLANLLLVDGRLQEAEEHLRVASHAFEESQDEFNRTSARREIGRLLARQSRHEEAIEHLREVEAQLFDHGRGDEHLTVLLYLSSLLRMTSHLEASLEVATRAESLATAIAIPAMVARARGEQALTLAACGRPHQAREMARRCFEDSPLADPPSLAEGSLTGARYAALWALLSTCGEEGDEATEAFDLLQRLKVRSPAHDSADLPFRQAAAVPESLLSRERSTRLRAEELGRALAAAAGHGRTDSLRAAVAEAEAHYQVAQHAVLRADERTRHTLLVQPTTLEEVRHRLVDDTTLVLDFVAAPAFDRMTPAPIYLLAVDAEGVQVHELGTETALRQQTALVMELLRTPALEAGQVKATRSALDELSEALLAPVAEQIARSRKVIVATDGFLHQVPFAALTMPAQRNHPARHRKGATDHSATAPYLAEHAVVVNTPSLTALLQDARAEPEERPPSKWDLVIWSSQESVAFAGPGQPRPDAGALAHARIERERLLGRFDRAILAQAGVGPPHDAGAAASKAAGEEGVSALDLLHQVPELGSCQVGHFIAHGIFDDLQPWRSGLYLTPGREPSTRLDIAGIEDLRLGCKLVVLSACEAARMDPESPNLLQGFAAALLEAGVGAVLAPLWPIDDAATPMFMDHFYQELAAGQTLDEALCETQRALIHHPRLAHPFYWASFVLMGDGDVGVHLDTRPSANTAAVLFIAGGLLLLVPAAWLWRRG